MSIVRSLVGYAPAVVLPRIVSLILVLVLTRLISKQEYGLVVLVATLGEAIDATFSNWTRVALARFAAADPEHVGRETTRSLAVYGATLAPSILFVVAFTLATRSERTIEFGVAILVYILAIGLLRFPSTIMAVQADRRGIVAMEAAKAVGVLIFGVAVTTISESFFTQTMIFGAVTAAVGLWGAIRCARRIDVRSGPRVPLGTYLAYGLPIIPAQIVGSVLSSSDRLFLDHTVGAEAVALYAAGVMLARQPMEFIFSLAGVRVFPLLMEDYERGGAAHGGRRLGELISGVVFITLPAAIGIVIVAEPMTELLLARDYVETATLIIPLAVISAFLVGFKAFVLDQIFHMVKRNGLNAVISLPAAVVGVGAMVLLVPDRGVWGCALAYLIQYVFLVLLTLVVTRRLMPFAIPWGDIARTAAATAVMAGVLLAVGTPLAVTPVWVQLVGSIVLGMVVYAAAALVLRPSPVEDLVPARFRRDRR